MIQIDFASSTRRFEQILALQKRCHVTALAPGVQGREGPTPLERDAIKWFKPARGQFQLYYRVNGRDPLEYEPDFVAEADDAIYMLEPKTRNQMDAPDVLAKQEVAVKWCANASDYTRQIVGKPW